MPAKRVRNGAESHLTEGSTCSMQVSLYLESLYGVRAWCHASSHLLQLCIVIAVLCLLASLQLVQRGYSNVYVTSLKKRTAVAKEESKKQCPDVSTVDICVCQ